MRRKTEWIPANPSHSYRSNSQRKIVSGQLDIELFVTTIYSNDR